MISSFLWVLLATALYGVLHSLLAANTAKALAARWIGQPAYRRIYRFFFSVMAVVSFLPVLLLVALLPDQTLYTIPSPWVFLTLALQGAAGVGILWVVLQTGAMRFIGLQQLMETRPGAGPRPEKLVESGLYHRVRHPLYALSLVLIWLAPVMTWNIAALNLGLTAYMLAGSIFEEKKLVEQFGQDYIEYRKRTPRILPRLRVRK